MISRLNQAKDYFITGPKREDMAEGTEMTQEMVFYVFSG